MAPYHYEDAARSSADESEIMLSELKHAKLQEHDEDDDLYTSSRKSLLKRVAFPISLVSNLLFFVFILFLLSQPCYFSARTCVYEKRDKDAQERAPLMADINKLVPECTYSSDAISRLKERHATIYLQVSTNSSNEESGVHERHAVLLANNVQKPQRIQLDPTHLEIHDAPRPRLHPRHKHILVPIIKPTVAPLLGHG
jgi:hypothetical protein